MNPRLTVLLPNYNGAAYLPDTLGSLAAQTEQDFLCLLLDDGSTDASVAVAEGWRARLPQLEIHCFENIGLGGNWNRGIARVRTEYFAFLHCDDAYEPGYIARMIELLDAHPSAALGHCGATTIDERGRAVKSPVESYKQRRYLVGASFQRTRAQEYRLLLEGSYINCPSVVYRTAAVREIGLFNPELKQVLDWDYWFRTLRAGYPICGSNARLYRYRRHSGNTTVLNSQDSRRYDEELNLLRQAHASGAAAGLVDRPLDTRIVRNIVINDIAAALSVGEQRAAREKIRYLSEQALAGPVILATLELIGRWRRVGGWFLRALVRAYVRLISRAPTAQS